MALSKAEARKKLAEMKADARDARQLSAQHLYAQGQLRRAGMPPAERNDSGAGDGARRKVPIRYD